MKRVPTFAVLVTLATICACDDTKQAPKGIDADGRVYVACSGFVRISGNMQEGYQVHFTDASGSEHDVRGIHKLEVEDLPDKTVCAQSKAHVEKGDVAEPKDNVSEACKEARANGTNLKWNDQTKTFDANPACMAEP